MDNVTYDPVLAGLYAWRDEFEELGLHDRAAETQQLIEHRIQTLTLGPGERIENGERVYSADWLNGDAA